MAGRQDAGWKAKGPQRRQGQARFERIRPAVWL